MISKKWNLLLKNSHIIDPSQKLNRVCDVAIKSGKISEIGKDLPSFSAEKVIDLHDSILVPGLIDMHCHIYPTAFDSPDCLPCIHADAHLLQNGVTTAVDAGTCGPRDFYTFKEHFIDRSKVRIFAFVNIASGGMITLGSEQMPSEFHPESAAGIAKTFPDIVAGIKTAHYWVNKPFDSLHTPWCSVDQTIEAADLCQKPAMFDFQPTIPDRSYKDLLLKKMRCGDIHTHIYAQQFPVVDENGTVSSFLFEARRKGIIFDLGHGAGSFWFRNAIPAYKQGFYPDTLSTDLYFDNICGPVFGMMNLMSKYLNIGMPLEEIIYRVTQRPAEILNHPELGTLRIGSCADIAVLKKLEGNYGFYDGGHARMDGTQKLECVMTIREGSIVYDLNAASMINWEQAPAAYWTPPGVL